MGTRGLKCLGKQLVHSIPTDPREYQEWLKEKRQMVNEWDDRYDRFLSIPADISEKKQKQISQLDEGFWAVKDDEKPYWQRPDFVLERYPPSFIAPLNDLFIKWVYTINLDQEVFSINNEVHYRLAEVGEIEGLFDIVYEEDYRVRLAPPKYRMSLALDDIFVLDYLAKSVFPNRKLVQPLNINNMPWNKRHGAIFRTLLFSTYRQNSQDEIEKGLSATLLQWRTEDFAFRELAYSILCLAVGGAYMTTMEQNEITQDIAYGFSSYEPAYQDKMHQPDGKGDEADIPGSHVKQDSSPELISQLLSGAHLEGLTPGASPNNTTYWFGGALIVLTTRLQEPQALERGLHKIAYHQQRLNGRTLNAVLMSIEHIVLVKTFDNGQLQHSAAMPLFKITKHSSTGDIDRPPPETEADIWNSEGRAERDLEQHAVWLSRHPHTDGDPATTFQALINFFDTLAYERLAPARVGEGSFPGEIYKIIIEHVLDLPTRHACMEVSRTFRDSCLQNLLIREDIMLLPSESCTSCIKPHIAPKMFKIRDPKAGIESRVAFVNDGEHMDWVQQGFMHILVGSEHNRKSILPFYFQFKSVEPNNQLESFESTLQTERHGHDMELVKHINMVFSG
ncbi:MAG: hypothetical protein Q9209_006467 [Squamulea sp. 1 TL-2023]